MRKRLAFVSVVFLIGGCAPTYTWVKTNASTGNFYQAKSYCQALSTGATPMDYSNSGTSTTYHSGTVYGSDGSYGSYSGTSSTYNNNMGQSLANLGQAMQRQRIFNDCMRGQGFVPQEELSSSYSTSQGRSTSPKARRSYARDITDWEESPASYDTATAKFEDTKLLFRPTFKAEELNLIPKGAKVKVLNEAADTWLKVRYKLQQGYVAKKWVTPKTNSDITETETSKSLSSPEESAESNRDRGWYVTPSDFSRGEIKFYEVTVRSIPDSSSGVRAILQKGQTVSVLNHAAEEWLRIKTGDIEGYVRAVGVKPI